VLWFSYCKSEINAIENTPTMQLVVFEDQNADALAPVTLTRPAMEISCGGYRLIDLLRPVAERYGATIQAVVRPHLTALVAVDHPEFATAGSVPGPVLLVNARLVPSVRAVNELEKIFREGKQGIIRNDTALVAACLPTDALTGGSLEYGKLQATIDQCELPTLDADLPLLEYPHDIVRYHKENLGENLEHRIACDRYQQTSDGVFLDNSTTDACPAIAETAVFDTTNGPVLIDQHAVIGPHTSIFGPCYIGAHAKISPGAALKGYVTLGHTAKVGGEIEGTIFEPYSNKQHEGVLGYSYLGSWINIGAGTNQSDLKNTYGSIRVQYGSQKIDTGMQFFGTIMGDYAKTAINTGIFTGKIIGVASTLYGMVTQNVPSFMNDARSLGLQGEIPADVAITTQRRMFARRSVEQRPCDEQLLRDVFAMTATDREPLGLSAEPLEF
jgi:UDP-N-acetylglucosamine diphosphorylase/glucosamine-1-phosphate N-acetyltransferase